MRLTLGRGFGRTRPLSSANVSLMEVHVPKSQSSAPEFKSVTLTRDDKTRIADTPSELVALQFDGFVVQESKSAAPLPK